MVGDGIAKSQGDLHVQEELGKSKRNLLWFCSFAILLWMVHVPADGTFQPPMLGGEAKLDMYWLRAAIWLACFYSFVGFWRQVRNVERLNSEAIYTAEFANLRARLDALATRFQDLAEQAASLRTSLAEATFPRLDTAMEPGDFFSKLISETLKPIREATFNNAEWSDEKLVGLRQIISDLENWKNYPEIGEEFRELKKATKLRVDVLNKSLVAVNQGEIVINEIAEIRSKFGRLSFQIRDDHRLLYQWYDKYLSYFMFTTASALSGWDIWIYLWSHSRSLAVEIWSVGAGWIIALLLLAVVILGQRIGRKILYALDRGKSGDEIARVSSNKFRLFGCGDIVEIHVDVTRQTHSRVDLIHYPPNSKVHWKGYARPLHRISEEEIDFIGVRLCGTVASIMSVGMEIEIRFKDATLGSHVLEKCMLVSETA